MSESPQIKHEHHSENSDYPGTSGIWIFVFLDMVVFLLMFLTYLSEKHRVPEVFVSSQQYLNEFFGLANTVILLTSSWAMAQAVKASRIKSVKQIKQYLIIAIALGFLFCINKVFEYGIKLDAGYSVTTNAFFSFYYVITGIHFLHVIGGLCFMCVMYAKSTIAGSSAAYTKGLENVGLFWHFVDVLWLFIFPLIYLTGLQ